MIFYFTGTGNSFAIAKHTAARFDGEQTASIAELINSNADLSIYDKEHSIGLVFPTYGFNPPGIVLDFCTQLAASVDFSSKYIYAIATFASNTGSSYLTLKKRLPSLNAWFDTAMPANGVILSEPSPQETIQKILAAAEVNISRFAEDIRSKKAVVMYKSSIGAHLLTKVAGPLGNSLVLNNAWKKFYADDKCIGCGKCSLICPNKNIVLKGKPVWGSNCNVCQGCINRCPSKAIQWGKSTLSRGRYVHPELD